MKRSLVIGAGLLVIAAISAAVLYGWARGRFVEPGPLAAAAIVDVPKGAGLAAIATLLATKGVVANASIFEWGVRLEGRAVRLRAGEFEFPAGVSPRDAMGVLIAGKSVQHKFTVAEGLTTSQIIEQLRKVEPLAGALTLAPGEGELLPDTYLFPRGETFDNVVRRMQRAMRTVLDDLWNQRAENLPYSSKREALILASIIEKETALDSERRRVAGVFVNRLRRGMRLQSDPTVIYGITGGKGALGRQLLTKDLETPGPYNTYVIRRLPPGPIANPGRASIAAALDPLATNELYFVADGNGGHVFAATIEEHARNVTKWRKLRRRQRRK